MESRYLYRDRLNGFGQTTGFTSGQHESGVMQQLLQDDAMRATAFFTLAFGLMVIGGFLIGELRVGVQWGFGLGLAVGLFAYWFITPTENDVSND